MSDWADDLASTLGLVIDDHDGIAAALRKAKAEGMREAAQSIMVAIDIQPRHIAFFHASELCARATEIEAGDE